MIVCVTMRPFHLTRQVHPRVSPVAGVTGSNRRGRSDHQRCCKEKQSQAAIGHFYTVTGQSASQNDVTYSYQVVTLTLFVGDV